MGLILTDRFPVEFTSLPLINTLDRLDPYSYRTKDTRIIVDENFGKANLTNVFDSVLMKKSVAINRSPSIHHQVNDVAICKTESFTEIKPYNFL